MTHHCNNNCCNIKINEYTFKDPLLIEKKRSRKKAGVFIYDPDSKKVLLVQSRGKLWGPPKGTIKTGENDKDCAIREVKEETGIHILESNLINMMKIKNNAIYYYVEMKECLVNIQDHIKNNDANGIGWINIDCLEKLITQGNMSLNRHAKFAFNKFLNKQFQESKFIEIYKTKKYTRQRPKSAGF